MKYYGIKKKLQHESILYAYAKAITRIHSFLPGTYRNFWKRNYDDCFVSSYSFKDHDNSLPKGKSFYLDQVVTAELIHREDIRKVQAGIRHLLKERRTHRFFLQPIEGADEICSRLEAMDATLLSFYEEVKCGAFDFKGLPLEKTIDYYTLSVKNMNSSFLELEFVIHLTENKRNELGEIIKQNYRDRRGYITQTMTSKRNGGGSFKNYIVAHYNNCHLKADRIYEFISCIEWEFYEDLKSFFPFLLHHREIMPPRIEIYYTDVGLQETHRYFLDSVGLIDYQGQSIYERQTIYFDSMLSCRYERHPQENRLIYIVDSNNSTKEQLNTINSDVHILLSEYAKELFRFLFLKILSRETAKAVVSYKHRLDRIKLQKRHLQSLLKSKYTFSKDIDDFNRYIRDDDLTGNSEILNQLNGGYATPQDEDKIRFIPSLAFCSSASTGAKEVKKDIEILTTEFEDKKSILLNLSDYKNTIRSIA